MAESATEKQYFVEFSPGDYVFRQKDEAGEMFIVEDGEIEIVLEDERGEQILTTLTRGDFFGEMAILENLPRSTSARARSSSRLLSIDRPVFDQILRTNPEFAVRMLRAMSSRLRDLEHSEPEPEEAGETVLAVLGRLADARGREYRLSSGTESTIGRFDATTRTSPTVDLGELDTGKTTSRRHARIRRRDGSFFLQQEVGTVNGTFVNGKLVQPGVEVEIQDGDKLEFGAVLLTFRKR
jgi:CRP-like cAMP-binding protein